MIASHHSQFEGFSPIPHHLPQSTGEGGCYAENCASIAAMMTGERILSHRVDGKVRDTIELCLHNAVLGGGSLDGKAFSYANKMATYGDETAVRADWFEGESDAFMVHGDSSAHTCSLTSLLLPSKPITYPWHAWRIHLARCR